ncbi:hypothetical protein [Burkholderia vietnamiensis]|uniref:hypothetical protein n=1 Tax=Burkholderia vietnamiensis TaxID=60552 RepID=UPI0015885F1A|nr:hypothetical protein [Burkholderia vietnamiensis]
MATENNSPTNGTADSANLPNSGGEIGVALSENDLASYLNDKTDNIPKAFEGKRGGEKGKMLPSPFDPHSAGGEDDSEVNSESEDSDDDLDLSLLDSDSTDTNASEADESDSEPVFEIQVDGQKFEVKQSELIADAQKYRASKTQFDDASRMRKEADEIKEVYTKDRDTLSNLLVQYQNFIEEAYKAQQPDWNYLRENDPLEYFKQKEVWEGKIAQANQAKAYQEQIRKQEEAEHKVELEKQLKQQQRKVFEMFPQWKNPEVAQRDAKRMETYLDAEGFTKAEQDGIGDARMLAVVHKAALYDQLVKANDQKKGNKPSGKTLNAGTSTVGDPGFAKRQAQTSAAREAKAWNDSLSKNPSQKNFEAYLLNQIIKGKK